MGFWHTGYIEHHESAGLGDDYKLAPPTYACVHCHASFSSVDELREHRFASHPLRRPVLFINGRELGTTRLRVAHPLAPKDVRVEACETAVLNGRSVRLIDLPRELSKVQSDVCHVVLTNAGVDAEFEIDIRVASARDLKGVEEQFGRLVRGRKLDLRAIEAFIGEASRYPTAISYCDGICSYLYGLLAKERAPDSSLPYEAYAGKFSAAAQELVAYDRPLARTVSGVIEFHFNHFRDAQRRVPRSRIGLVSAQMAGWIGNIRKPSVPAKGAIRVDAVEAMVTDLETERILDWSTQPVARVVEQSADIERYIRGPVSEYDKLKLHLLLAETYRAAGDMTRAKEHAKALRNLESMESWADALIGGTGERK